MASADQEAQRYLNMNIEDSKFLKGYILLNTILTLLFTFVLLVTPCNAERRNTEPVNNKEIDKPFNTHQDSFDSHPFQQQEYLSSDKDSETQPISHKDQEKRPLGYYDYRFYKSFGGFGMGNGFFEDPVDVSIDTESGDIFICEANSARIQRFDSDGNFEEQWESIEGLDSKFSRESEKMDNPQGICVDYKDRIGKTVVYVADTKNNRILQFDKEGVLIDSDGKEIKDISAYIHKQLLWGGFGSSKGKFHHPTDISVDSRDNTYVLDSRNSRIQCFNDEGQFRFQWGGFGSTNGSFIKPIRLAYDQTGFGSIWVLDASDGRVHQFELSGNFVRAITPKDENNKSLTQPVDIAIDSHGFVFIPDGKMNKIFKYNNDIEFIQYWGGDGNGDGQFKRIKGIAIDENENVVVVDQGNCRIQVFRRF